jgi:ABC-type glycerol-3-phosphate transport system permease component
VSDLAGLDATSVPVVARAPRRSRRPRLGGERVLLHLLIAAYCLSSAGAFVWYVIASLKTNTEFLTKSPWTLPAHPHFGNFISVWHGTGLATFFVNSALVTSASVVLGLIVAAMAAYVFARVTFWGKELLMGLLLVGMLMPTFGSMIPLYFFLRDLHLLGTRTGLVLVYVATQVPLSVYVLRRFYEGLPIELEEAAYIDGASPLRAFFGVVVPQTYPAISALAVLNALTIWNEFVLALILLPDQAKQTLPIGLLGLSVQATYSGDWVQLFAALVLSSIPMLILFVVAQERIARGIALGGVKG